MADQPTVSESEQPKLMSFDQVVAGQIFTNRYIQGLVHTVYPTQVRGKKKVKKIVLAEEDKPDIASIDVFLVGIFADQCGQLHKGDKIRLCKFFAQKSASTATAGHVCQLVLDTAHSQAKIWVKPKSNAAAQWLQPSLPGGSTDGQLQTKRQYGYTQLKDVKEGTIINVYAVVRFFKPPVKTRGSDFHMVLSLVDPSLEGKDDKLRCNLFNKDIAHLPQVKNVGDIVRLHRLKVTTYRDNLQGQCGPGFSSLVFDGADDGKYTKRSSHQSPTFTEVDKEKVDQLRVWANGLEFSQGHSNCLSECHIGQYFDLICQVVATAVTTPGEEIVLQVWDGTIIQSCPVYKADTSAVELKVSQELLPRARQFLHDVFVYDDHFVQASTVQPGDFIKLCNLHALAYKNPDANPDEPQEEMIQLCLHHGSSFGRRLERLHFLCKEVKDMRQTLENIQPDIVSDNSLLLVSDKALQKVRTIGQNGKSAASNTHQGVTHTQPEQNRCMLQTATVLTNVYHVERTLLRDVVSHEVPYKFRVQAKVIEFVPRVSSPQCFLKLYCHHCHFLSPLPDLRDTRITTSTDPTPDSMEENKVYLPSIDHETQEWEEVKVTLMQNTVKAKKLLKLNGKIVEGEPVYIPELSDLDFLELVKMGRKVIFLRSPSEQEPAKTTWHQSAQPALMYEGVPYYKCPQCTPISTQEEQVVPSSSQKPESVGGKPVLQYIYMLKLLLTDHSGWLTVQLWGKEAEKFFMDIKPEDLLQEGSRCDYQTVVSYLNRLCPSPDRKADRPWIECCIKSYHTEYGTCYQVFDTVLVEEDVS